MWLCVMPLQALAGARHARHRGGGRLAAEGCASVTRVSIGVPVYNGETYLAETLDSLLAQSFEDFEIIISDNASTDRTPEICRAYQNKDPRVRYFRSDRNLGAAW